ncbi:ABC transporter permease subunit [Chitinimonas sp. BJB300]|uniref:ABC transporter permease subunit n=1 Tax=Chitinimonas sp. BJB300 TaxID=1559339 RepID=UPI000C0E0037|nr:ABC transporter ATP-binding protein [Chitinimonas sp. BJB300]PHV10271.1 ABC transporter ATP-binding protein [Chitinimonas sp. BJB300]TSJ83791.1 ABC transporter ATP-binding protein [Chitinimonas sp. BJB300]
MLTFSKKNKVTAYIGMAVFAVVLAVLPFIMGATLGNTWVRNLDLAMLYIMLALGLNIVVGYAGLLDLGYIAFYAVGAYVYALLNSPHLVPLLAGTGFEWILHMPLLVVLPLAALMAGLFGVLLGSPTLKLRGDYLAIVTLGFGEIVRLFMNNLDRPINITNGPQGVNLIEPVSLFGHKFSQAITVFGVEFRSVHLYYYLFLALALMIIVVSIRLQSSRIGRAWVAIREDEIAAQAMGINTRNVKLLAFAMGASFGGVSGAMFASFQGFVSPESFILMESIVVLAMVVLGGMGHIPGVILGAILLFLTPEVLRDVVNPLQDKLLGERVVNPENLRMLLFGLALIFVMLVRPEGLWPSKRRKAELHEKDEKAAAEAAEKESAHG